MYHPPRKNDAVLGTFDQEKAQVVAFSVIVQPVVEPMDRFTLQH